MAARRVGRVSSPAHGRMQSQNVWLCSALLGSALLCSFLQDF